MEKNPPRLPGYQLPTQPHASSGRIAEGFFTPTQDLMPQRISIPPKRVLPIIFLPGIMGSNLRMSAARQSHLRKKNNIAWRPESLSESTKLLRGNARLRQNQLDPSQTEVDEYDPVKNPTGDPEETSDQRHGNAAVKFQLLHVGVDSPLLMDDPVTVKPRNMKDQKARERGWGEVFSAATAACWKCASSGSIPPSTTAIWIVGGSKLSEWHHPNGKPVRSCRLNRWKKRC